MELSRAERGWRRFSSSPTTIVLVLIAIGFVYWASPVLIPLALSVLLAFLLNPIVTFLQRRKVPRVAAAFLVTTAAVLLIGGIGWIFLSQLVQLGEQLPGYERKVTQRIDEIRENGQGSLFVKVQSFADSVTRAATRRGAAKIEDAPQRVVLVGDGSWSLTPLFSALGPVLEPLAALGLVIVQLIYLLIDSESLRDRFLRLAGQSNMTLTTRALDDVGSRISRYLLAQFGLNAAFGTLVGLGLWFLGVPHALLGGFMAGFLRYIPYLGPWLAVTFPLLLSLISTDGWLQPIGVVLVFATLELFSNIVVEPLVYGRSIGVSQSSLIVAIAFWAWLWGPMGLVLAAPLTVCLAMMGKYIPALKFFDIILGDSSPLTTDVRLYQRLLAHDEDNAYEIATTERADYPLVALFDRLLIPALCSAKRDLVAKRLEEEEAIAIWTLVAEIGEELAVTQVQDVVDEAEVPETPLVPRVLLLACAARDGADDAALRLVQCALDPQLVDIQLTSANRLASEVTSLAEDSHPAIALVMALPPGELSKARLLCKRLRQGLPELKIVVGRFGIDQSQSQDQRLLLDAGADFVGETLEQTSEQLSRFARLLRPATNSWVQIPSIAKNAKPAATT